MSTELKAPPGKTRVVGVDLLGNTDHLVKDYAKKKSAFKIADKYNSNRSGNMNNVYCVYDDKGKYIRGNEAVGQSISP